MRRRVVEETVTKAGAIVTSRSQTGVENLDLWTLREESGSERVCAATLQEKAKRAKEAAEKERLQEQTWCDVKVTTSVYVTGLPDDVTEEELAQVIHTTLTYHPVMV